VNTKREKMNMHNPPHPGLLVRRALIDEGETTVTEAATLLGVTRLTLSKLINGHSGISPEMAIRLSIVLNTSSQMWLNMQMTYDLWLAEKKRRTFLKKVKRLEFPSEDRKAS